MNRCLVFLAAGGLLGTLEAAAQPAQGAGPRKVAVYLTASGQQLPTAAGADHRAEIAMRDSLSGFMREYYPSVVDARAAIAGATVVKTPAANLGQAALDAVQRIAPFEAPGTADQENVSVVYTLPIKVGKPERGWNLANAYDKSPKITFLADELAD